MEWDSEDGLNHTLYRQYTPGQGRWETPDPKQGCVNFPQGQNLYAYVKDNATNAVDPQGDQNACVGMFETSSNPCGCCVSSPSFWNANSTECCEECSACDSPKLPAPVGDEPLPAPAGGGGGSSSWGGFSWPCGPTGHLALNQTKFLACLHSIAPVLAISSPLCALTLPSCIRALGAAAFGGPVAIGAVAVICGPAAVSCGVTVVGIAVCAIDALYCEPNVVAETSH